VVTTSGGIERGQASSGDVIRRLYRRQRSKHSSLMWCDKHVAVIRHQGVASMGGGKSSSTGAGKHQQQAYGIKQQQRTSVAAKGLLLLQPVRTLASKWHLSIALNVKTAWQHQKLANGSVTGGMVASTSRDVASAGEWILSASARAAKMLRAINNLGRLGSVCGDALSVWPR